MVKWTHAERLWQGQSLLMEPHQGFVSAAASGFRVPVGLGVSLMPMRHPYEAALQARSVAMTTGHSVVAGFGPGSRSFQAGLRISREDPEDAARALVESNAFVSGVPGRPCRSLLPRHSELRRKHGTHTRLHP